MNHRITIVVIIIIMSVILATAGYDHTIRFWEAPSGICSHTLRHSDSQVNCLEITPDKQFLAAGGNPQIRLYDINNPSVDQPVLTLEGHTAAVTSLGFQRDGRYLYSGSEDGTYFAFCIGRRYIVVLFSHFYYIIIISLLSICRYSQIMGFTIAFLLSFL